MRWRRVHIDDDRRFSLEVEEESGRTFVAIPVTSGHVEYQEWYEVDAETFANVMEDTVGGAALAMGDTTRGAWRNMMAALSRAGASVQRIDTGTAPTAATRATVVTAAQQVDLTVALTMNVGVGSAQAALVNELEGAGVDLVSVAVRNPYDVARHDAGNALCTYSYSPVVPDALVRVITGAVDPQGKLPVDVPTADGSGVALPFGHGLSY